MQHLRKGHQKHFHCSQLIQEFEDPKTFEHSSVYTGPKFCIYDVCDFVMVVHRNSFNALTLLSFLSAALQTLITVLDV